MSNKNCNICFLMCTDENQLLEWKKCKYFNTWHMYKAHSKLLLTPYCICLWEATISESLSWNQFAKTRWTHIQILKCVEEFLEQMVPFHHLSCWGWISGQRRFEYNFILYKLLKTKDQGISFFYTLAIWLSAIL